MTKRADEQWNYAETKIQAKSPNTGERFNPMGGSRGVLSQKVPAQAGGQSP
jgi:hypothetical protein